MDGKGREGAYIFSHDEWGQPEQDTGAAAPSPPPTRHLAGADHGSSVC